MLNVLVILVRKISSMWVLNGLVTLEENNFGTSVLRLGCGITGETYQHFIARVWV